MSVEHELKNSSAERIEVDRVSKSFATKHRTVLALDSVSLKISEGEFVCLVGVSGCGKSTLLNIVAGLEQPDSGRVLANGEPVTGPGRDRMVMFQEHALFPWLDVMGNVLFGDLQAIWQARRKTILFVTHNVREAACLGDRVVLFSPNPGRIRKEFLVTLPRPRDINSVELAHYSTEITAALKGFAPGEGLEASE